MKRIAAFFLFALCFGALCLAQSALETAGSFYVYDYKDVPAMTPSPRGYKPFYISHFARHGARYCTSEYDKLYGYLQKAEKEGLLSEGGKAFLARYEPYYQKVRYCSGNLSAIGKDQHRSMGRNMYRRFPGVFKGHTRVQAVSTESPRVIMSMWSCLSSLQELDRDLEVVADASARYAPWLQPSLKSNPYLVKGWYSCGDKVEQEVLDYFEQTVPWRSIVRRFFTDESVLKGCLEITPQQFIGALQAVVACTRCLEDDRGCFDDVFSPEEAVQVWKGLAAPYFLHTARYAGSECMVLDYAAFTLEQIIERADEDMASGDTQLRLRFGHDSGIAPLLVLLDADGCGREAASFSEAQEIFPDYKVPMGASLQLVFYRNAAGNILLKALVCEREATLPLPSAGGPYYRWEDFKAYYLPLVQEARANIERKRGL